MTKEQALKFIPILTALAEGKTIQIDISFGLEKPRWTDGKDLKFDDDPERYRVKPEPSIIYCVRSSLNTLYGASFRSQEEAIAWKNKLFPGEAASVVKFVEQLP